MSRATFLNSYTKLLPWWLHGAVAQSLATMFDDFRSRAYRALLVRFPEYAASTVIVDDGAAIAALGRDRRTARGINEPAAAYGERVRTALGELRRRGNPFAMLVQVQAYLQNHSAVRRVDYSSNWFMRDEDETHSTSHGSANWDWDSTSNPEKAGRWWRFWLIARHQNYATGSAWTQSEGTWGDGDVTGDGTKSIGLSVTPDVVEGWRRVVANWKRSGEVCEWLIVALDNNIFDDTESLGSPTLPDGEWGRWSKTEIGADGMPRRVAARSSDARYIVGVVD